MPTITGFRLAPQQKRLWLAQQGGADFCSQCVVAIEGDPDVAALRQSLLDLTPLHDALRTTFLSLPKLKVPVQVVNDEARIDWRSIEIGEAEEPRRIEEILSRERETPFEYERHPLARAALLTLSKRRRLLALTLPALCADRRGLSNLVAGLVANYGAGARNGRESDAALQYTQFSEWQNEVIESEHAREAGEYWRRQDLSGLFSTRLPFEKPLDSGAPLRQRVIGFTLAPDLAAGLDALSRRMAVPASAVWLACWQALLWRLTGQENIAIAQVFDNREHEGFDRAVGLFANWAPVKAGLDGSLRLDRLIRLTHEEAQQAAEWQEFFHLQPSAKPAGDVPQSSGLPIGFEYAETLPPSEAAGVTFSIHSQYCCAHRFKLALVVTRSIGAVRVEFYYDAGAYAGHDVEAAGRYLERLLDGGLKDASMRIDQLPLLDPVERRRLITAGGGTIAELPGDSLIHRWFERRAKRCPDRLAVIDESGGLSYRRLNQRANQLAHLLRELGVAANAPVGLMAGRSVQAIVGMLGVMKAGGAYAPLDPEQPVARLANQLSQSGAGVLITEERMAGVLGQFAGQVVFIDSDQRLRQQREDDPEPVNRPEDLAYIIFTSGSTGTPKGVAVTHRSLANYSAFICNKLRLGRESSRRNLSFGAVSTISADLGNTAIFPSLISGGRLHLISYEVATDGTSFLEYVSRNPIDVLKIVPSHLGALFSEGGGGLLPRRYLILGGEALTFDLFDRLHAAAACEIINHYGPTEATVGVLTCDAGKAGAAARLSATVPIGAPITNAEAYILDPSLEPAPPGVAGELYVGGEGLAVGYINQSEQTAARFVPHDFTRRPGARLYRTGDLARSLPDGAIEFLGRADQQVKIRGYRIELGEIEAALLKHDAVREAVVSAHEDPAAGKRLVAYLVASRNLSGAELSEWLKDHLPSYMIPAAYLPLDRLPLTRNGKVNRKELPAPELALTPRRRAYVAPRNQAEETLARIWEAALDVERVGIYDNFFELGGDSILSIQIVSRANRAGLRLKADDVFKRQTIAELGAIACPSATDETRQEVVTGEVPLTPIQRQFFESSPADPHYYNQSVLLDLRREVDPVLLEQAVRALLLHHDGLRMRFHREAEAWRQVNEGVSDGGEFAAIDLSDLAEARQAKVIEWLGGELQASLDLSAGPLLRVALFRLGDAKGRILIIIHHLVVDGVSWRILLEDLHTAYEQLRQGSDIAPPPKTTSFKQWAERLAGYAQSEPLRREAPYWTAACRRDVEPLPRDYESGANMVADGRAIEVKLSAAETRALLREAPLAYRAQINDFLLTALARAFARWSASGKLLVGLEGHGREDLFGETDLSRTTGWFTSYFPAFLDLDGAADPGEALKKIKEQLRAIPNRGVGYGALRHMCEDRAIVESLRALPEAEVGFNYLGKLDQAISEHSLWTAAAESAGPTRGAAQRRRHLIDINAGISGGQLWLVWTYSGELHKRETVEALAAAYIGELRNLIAHCREAVAGYTPSDFPLANLDQKKLDEALGARRDVADLYPLSPMQQGLLFHSLSEPDSRVYFVQTGYRLRGDFDEAAFEQAWRQVIERHEILRASFLWQGLDKPLQVVRKEVAPPLEKLDFQGLDEAEQKRRLDRFAEQDRAKGFDLRQAPLIRLAIIRLTASTLHLICSNHHLIMDGWSRRLIMDEVFACYQAFSRGETPSLESRRPFRDYIAWLQRQDPSKAAAFWRDYLKGLIHTTRVGAGSTSRSETQAAFDEKRFRLSRETTAALQAYARSGQITLNTIVQGAWAILLSRYGNQADVAFGAIVSGRPPEIPGIETMVGLMINIVPVRARVDASAPALPYLRQLQAEQSEARQYDYAPLAQIQEWSEAPQGRPLFESLLAFENYPGNAPAHDAGQSHRPPLEIEDVQSVNSSNYPLALVAGGESELAFSIAYDTRRYTAAEIDAMASYLRRILETIAAGGERLIREIPVREGRVAAPQDAREQFNFEG